MSDINTGSNGMIKIKKRMVPYIILSVELIVFLGMYIAGVNGFITLYGLKADNEQYKKTVEVLEQEVASLEKQLRDFNSERFYKEKIAREELQMARPGEIIYYLK
ncbi:MAG TPA: septum formation initiator family protein [Candidatus Babeliales bacterium]|nr:septum formation initiator family protein [Candidatus Babeliales bacterium]